MIERPSDLSDDWLTAASVPATVTDFGFERIGTGQMSECYRVALTYADGGAGPESVVLKVAATDPSSRQTGLALGLYEREVRFYTDIAPHIGGPVAPCYHAGFDSDTGAFHLLLGDAGPAPLSATRSAARQSNRPRWRWPSWVGCTPRCSVTPQWPRRPGSTASHR